MADTSKVRGAGPPIEVEQDTGETWPGPCLGVTPQTRSVSGQRNLLLSGASLGRLEGLLGTPFQGTANPTLDPSVYDRATIFPYHDYDPVQVTSCGDPSGPSYSAYLSGIPYPPTGIDPQPYIDATVNRINADSTLSDATKAAYATQYTADLRNFFINKGPPSAIQARFRSAREWAAAYGIDANQVMLGETGARAAANSASLLAPVASTCGKSQMLWDKLTSNPLNIMLEMDRIIAADKVARSLDGTSYVRNLSTKSVYRQVTRRNNRLTHCCCK